jgi:uncharacterized OsmC-like protein
MSDGSSKPTAEGAPVLVRLVREDGYRFSVDFGEGLPPLVMDEPAPLGVGSGPNAARVLGAAVGNCLAASLLYCLDRARVEVTDLRAEVAVTTERNPDGRLRIGSIRVQLSPELAGGSGGRVQRCLDIFEDYCVVTGSVRSGIAVDVAVNPRSASATAAEGDAPVAG